MREYPLEYEKTRPVTFYPDEPEDFNGDILEIGPGRGDFLFDLASAKPNKRIFAVELGRRRFEKICGKIDREDVSNIIVIRGNARVIVSAHFKPKTLDAIYLFFPDPWPKTRYRMNRLVSTEFITLLATLLKPNGLLYMATDVPRYAKAMVKETAPVETLMSLGDPYIKSSAIENYTSTFFEDDAHKEGRGSFFLGYRRK